jgi:orotate phosphoribosyltransferase
MISAPQPDIAKKAAKILLDTKSVLFNARDPFVFTSGRISPVYTDCRRLISFPQERSALMDMGAAILKEKIGMENMDFLAGGETAGIPYAAFLSDRLNKPMLYVRKKPKGFGRMAQIEGCMDAATPKVILIEDLQTDGGSKKVFIDALRAAGATVEHGFVVFHYGIFQQSIDNMNAMGMTLHYLTDWWAVLQTAKDLNYFDNETLSSVEAFLNSPDAWADANAHRVAKKEQA